MINNDIENALRANAEMTEAQHKIRHMELHKMLDELTADYLFHTGISLNRATVMDLIRWSHRQTTNPTLQPANEQANQQTIQKGEVQ